ncbi:MAG: hypothetical protein WCG94_05505, partial [Methanothrix sp.]
MDKMNRACWKDRFWAWLMALLFILVVVGLEGEKIGFRDSALQSLGKAFNKFTNTTVVSANEAAWCT